MKVTLWIALAALLVPLSLAGCAGNGTGTTPPPAQSKDKPDPKIEAALAKLSPEDRKLAEEQQFCAVMEENRLGVMGTPVKVMVEDQPVFLCCKSCKDKALENPEQTLAKVKELKAKAGE